MLFLDKTSQDPWFNLAVEEYLIRQTDLDVFMLWENAPCLVIGKHQTPVMEINAMCLIADKIPVIRRISGGGTVFHGPGNLNFTFITTSKENEDKINFPRFTKPILDYLNSKQIPAEITGKSNLTVNGLKFSGNAAHVFKNRSIHHGTLLFDADINQVNQCIRKADSDIQTKAVQSNRAMITNLKPLFSKKHSFIEFKSELKSFICNAFAVEKEVRLTEFQKKEIEKLANSKYKSDDWNYGYSPSYQINRTLKLFDFETKISVSVNKGIISSVITNYPHNNSLLNQLQNKLPGTKHNPPETIKVLREIISEPTQENLVKSILYQLF